MSGVQEGNFKWSGQGESLRKWHLNKALKKVSESYAGQIPQLVERHECALRVLGRLS